MSKKILRYKNPLITKSKFSIPKKIAIVGAGTIGPDIGYYFKTQIRESELFLLDINKDSLFLAEKRIDEYLKKAVKYNKLSLEKTKLISDGIHYTLDYDDIAECNLVIEAATENLLLKRKIFSKIETLVSEKTVITSNTSSIPGSRIFSKVSIPGRTAVTHFFAPAWKNFVVEVVPWEKTNSNIIEYLAYIFCYTGKVPICVKDKVCFMYDRIFDNWCNEAGHLLEYTTAMHIDKVAEEFVHAGPFFVLNMAKGNQIIFETNSLQMEEGPYYKPSNIFKSVDKWLTGTPGSECNIPIKVRNKVRDRLLGILFSQSFDIINKEIGTLEDLNFGSQVALGFKYGPMDLMNKLGEKEVNRIGNEFIKSRGKFPWAKKPFDYYQKFKRYVLEDTINQVKIITIRRPQRLNTINNLVTQEILEILSSCSNDEKLKGFIITGYGAKAFSAGADIDEFTKMLGNYYKSIQYAKDCSKVQLFIDKMKKPIVAAISGLALGGGLEIAIRCHGIVANINSVFQFPEVLLGILPGIGGCVIPYRKWPGGNKVFNSMLMLGRKITVNKAREIGMVDHVVNSYDSLISKSIEMVHKLSKNFNSLSNDNYQTIHNSIDIPDIKVLDNLNLSIETINIIKETIEKSLLQKKLEDALDVGYDGFGKTACTKSAKKRINSFIKNKSFKR